MENDSTAIIDRVNSMRKHLFKTKLIVGCLCSVFLTVQSAVAADAKVDAQNAEVQRVADRIDEFIQKQWNDNGIEPAHPADDAEFLRRAWLDIAGKIPPAGDVLDFLEDDSPTKRQQLIEDLLDGPNYVQNYTRFWRRVFLPEVETNFNIRFLTPGFEQWLRSQLLEDVTYDDLAREILTTPLNVNAFQQNPNSPIAFYQAKETKPENLAAATSRIFLGVRIECAQCHDHPFDNWKQKDFWGYATFFGSMGRANARGAAGFFAMLRERLGTNKLQIPDTNEFVPATFLTGESPAISSGDNPRKTLADWIISAENPYFAQAAANRMWGKMFGIGLVDPVDDFSLGNPASHPELLEFLGKEFAAHDFDLKFLLRAITRSRTWQLSSRKLNEEHDPPPELFARMAIKGMTAEQLYDSIQQATGFNPAFNPQENGFAITPRKQFVTEFTDASSAPTERQKSVLQALAIMNGQEVNNATNPERARTLRAIAEFPGFDNRRQVESLFLATLSRKPHSAETDRYAQYVESADDPKSALADVFWALLNSNEFSINH